MTIIAFLWPYFFDYIIFDFEIQFIITFYGSYDTLDKDRFSALDIRADFFLLALSLFCVVTSTQEATSLSDDLWWSFIHINANFWKNNHWWYKRNTGRLSYMFYSVNERYTTINHFNFTILYVFIRLSRCFMAYSNLKHWAVSMRECWMVCITCR